MARSRDAMEAMAGVRGEIFSEHTQRLLGDQVAQFVEAQQRWSVDLRTLETLTRLAPSSTAPYIDAMAGMRAEMDRHASMFRDIGATLARALEVPAFIRDLKLPTRQEVEAGHRRFVRAAELLAKAGWTFPTGITVSDIVRLAEQYGGRNADALDDWFIDYYAAERGREFRALASRLLRRKRLETWRGLLRESLWAYRRGKYRLAIPALLTTIEGLVYEMTGSLREKGVNASQHWRERATKPPTGFIVAADWCTVAAFLESLWCRHEFDGPTPDGLNR